MPSPCPTLGHTGGELRHELDPRPITLLLCPPVLFPCMASCGKAEYTGWGLCPPGSAAAIGCFQGAPGPQPDPTQAWWEPLLPSCPPTLSPALLHSQQECALVLAHLAHVSPTHLQPPASCRSLGALFPVSWDTGDALQAMKKCHQCYFCPCWVLHSPGPPLANMVATTVVSCGPSPGGDGAIWRGQGHLGLGES